MESKNVKLVVFVPISHTDKVIEESRDALEKAGAFVPKSPVDQVREALAKAGAGKMGNYDSCSFSSKGVGRFRGNENSHPAIGEPGKLEMVEEERIEVL